jgi:hypothetical protein
MLHNIIAYIHVLISFIASIYFLYRNNNYDIYYVLYFCILNISWTLFNNECIISYAYKKLHNTDYKLGETTDIKDYDIVLGKKNSMVFLNYILVMYAFNFMYLLFFSKSIQSISIPMIVAFLSFMIYIVILRKKEDSDKKDLVQGVNFISNSILLSFIIHSKYLK